MSERGRGAEGQGGGHVAIESNLRPRPGEAPLPMELLSLSPSVRLPLSCNRCGFAVPSRAWGCTNPCRNCGTIYPLGDCSD